MTSVKAGDRVLIRDAQGGEHPAMALGRMERGHSFPIIRIRGTRKDGLGLFEMPWPADAVRLADRGQP